MTEIQYSKRLRTFISAKTPPEYRLSDVEVGILEGHTDGTPVSGIKRWDEPDGDPHQKPTRTSQFYLEWYPNVDLDTQTLRYWASVEAKSKVQHSFAVFKLLSELTDNKRLLGHVANDVIVQLPEAVLVNPVDGNEYMFLSELRELRSKLGKQYRAVSKALKELEATRT